MPTPTPVFSELHILKGFKCCALKLRILQGLEVDFGEVRIPKGIVASDEGLVGRGSVGRVPCTVIREERTGRKR